MSDLTIKVCDICDRYKGESNHWFSFYTLGKTYLTTPLEIDHLLNHAFLEGWDRNDICSADCLIKAESRTRDGEKLR